MDGVNVGNLSGAHDSVGAEIAFGAFVATDADRFIGQLNVKRLNIGFGIDGERLYAQFTASTNDAKGNFTAIGDEDFREHVSVLLLERRDGVTDHSGMLLCLRHGFSTFLSCSMASERQIRLRVSCGMITSSM